MSLADLRSLAALLLCWAAASLSSAAEPITRVAAPPFTPPEPHLARVVLEMSLKPFDDLRPEAVRAVCGEVFRQWAPLVRRADAVAVMLWSADGSEILDYGGKADAEIRWAMYIGHPNPREKVRNDKDGRALHSGAYLYREKPPRMTYGDLARIVATLKEVGHTMTGKPVQIGATFDPGGEFAYSPFKYERHNEICLGATMGKGSFVCCYGVLHGDQHPYAGFPQGIAEGTSLGTFLGRQSQHFLTDLGFDYLWFSNGFGFGMETWKTTGPLFDGKKFDAAGAPAIRDKILAFWKDFRAECPKFPIETRGTNLATGIDLASNAVPLRDIYSGGFNIEPPPNSPWAALNGDFGLELAGYMSRIAELPPGKSFPFRYYVHDPWWLNSPWLDRYAREPHDIYLPLAVGRVNARGVVETPRSLALLTIDDSYGRMPPKCPEEVIPHVLAALADAPDRPGPLVWLYPFDEYHDKVFGPHPQTDESFFGDWFLRAAINNGFPLNTVVSTRSFLASQPQQPALYRGSVLVTPVPDADTPLEKTLLAHLDAGGQVLFYGPATRASAALLKTLNLRAADPIAGELALELTAPIDDVAGGGYPRKLNHREAMSGGGCGEVLAKADDPATQVVARVARDGQQRIAALTRKLTGGGRLAWVRGTNSNSYVGGHLLTPDDRTKWFAGDLLLRAVLPSFGCDVRMVKRAAEQPSPVLAIARHNNGFYFSGYVPNTNVGLQLQMPDGAPIFSGLETELVDGRAQYRMPRAWHRECRVMVRQAEGEILCAEQISGAIGVTRRLRLTGLKDATVTFFPDQSVPGQVTMQPNPKSPFLDGPFLDYRTQSDARGTRLVAEKVSGALLISW